MARFVLGMAFGLALVAASEWAGRRQQADPDPGGRHRWQAAADREWVLREHLAESRADAHLLRERLAWERATRPSPVQAAGPRQAAGVDEGDLIPPQSVPTVPTD